MIYGIFGEPCVGKSELATALKKKIGGKIVSNRAYLHYAAREEEAERIFKEMLDKESGNVFFIISEPYELYFLPRRAIRVKLTATIETIEKRYAEKMYGHLPEDVKTALEDRHGTFDFLSSDFTFTQEDDLETKVHKILE